MLPYEAMTSSQARLANTIETFYGAADRNSDGAIVGNAYKRAVDDLDSSITTEFVSDWHESIVYALPLNLSLSLCKDTPYRTTVLEPVGKMCSFFPLINENIAKREKKMLDFDAARSRLRKLIDKPSEDPMKMPKVCFFLSRRRRCLTTTCSS